MKTIHSGTAVTCFLCDAWGRVKPEVADQIIARCGVLICAQCERGRK